VTDVENILFMQEKNREITSVFIRRRKTQRWGEGMGTTVLEIRDITVAKFIFQNIHFDGCHIIFIFHLFFEMPANYDIKISSKRFAHE
jgi:hypothetical protein